MVVIVLLVSLDYIVNRQVDNDIFVIVSSTYQIDYCQPNNPCLNRGQCYSTANSFLCDCSNTGFAGPTCAEPIVRGKTESERSNQSFTSIYIFSRSMLVIYMSQWRYLFIKWCISYLSLCRWLCWIELSSCSK